MASRCGARPIGSDGSDFQHRERVVEPYKTLAFTPFYEEGMDHLFSYPFKYPLPPNDLWEYAWAFGSVLPVLFGYLSFGKNKVYLIRLSLLGTIVFGFVPIVMGCFLRAYELMDYYYTKQSRHNLFNFPFVVLIYIFFSICIQIHSFSLYFSWKLMTIWSRLSKKHV
ncbi:unnamed protein product [Mesocestoides corti]|uniref:Uncharacterized protein n=1 Tax=Mesocestoides corti TaxID=53468 RepID=A0A0R3UP82_MESCO|nr:unnamed protein product [Mesocestoides corti]